MLIWKYWYGFRNKSNEWLDREEKIFGRKKLKKKTGLSKAFKEWLPTSSTRPKPPTPRVSMMLKSDSFRLAKKAASASYLEFLMRKNGNFLEVQTRVPRTTVPEWHDCETGFTCLNSILLLESAFSHTHTFFFLVPVVQNNLDLSLYFQSRKIQSTHCMPVMWLINPVIKSVTSRCFSTRLLMSTDCLCCSLLVLFWIVWFCLALFLQFSFWMAVSH